jgi:hypothetical protein
MNATNIIIYAYMFLEKFYFLVKIRVLNEWIFSKYFSYQPLTGTYVPIRAIHVPRWSACSFALSGPYGLSDEFFAGP